MQKIESLKNEKVKKWCKLKEKKGRDEEGYFLIEGDHLIEEALKEHLVKELITTEEKSYPVDTYLVTNEILKKITEQQTVPSSIAVCKKLEEKEIEGNVVILDGLQDPGNLGTILRSAKAFSIPNVILSLDSVDLYNPKVIRSTEGLFFSLNIIRADLSKIIPKLKEKGYFIYGTDVLKGNIIQKENWKTPHAIIIGNEGTGLKEETKSYCDSFLYIPISKDCESLNASVAASILFYESEREKHE